MGLVQRQGIKYSIINWFGILIGALSIVFVYPLALEEYGAIRFFLDTTLFLFPVLSFGIGSVAIRFFPVFEEKSNGHHGYLGLLLLWGGISYIIFGLIALCLWGHISDFYAKKNPEISNYIWIIFPTSFFYLLNFILNQYVVNFGRIVIPSLLIDVSQKIVIPILLVVYIHGYISLEFMLCAIPGYLFLVSVLLYLYIQSLGENFLRIDFSFIDIKMVKNMLYYAVYGVIGGLGFFIVTKLDTWTVPTYIGLKSNGVYSISAFIAGIMEVPLRGIVIATTPLISKSWYNENIEQIKELYQKASINLFMAGLLLFGTFWVSVEPFFRVVANGEVLESGKILILILGVGKLFDMSAGLNNHILSYSNRFYLSYAQIILSALLGITVSVLLLPGYGMVGAALATVASTIFLNLLSLYFNWKYFRIQPFTMKFVKAFLIGLAAYSLVSFMPVPASNWWTIVIKSGTFATFFLLLVLRFRISPELNQAVFSFLEKARKKF